MPQTGVATFYADGLMSYVEGYRRERGQVADCPECVGAVALLRAGDIGRKVWLQPPGGEPVGPFLVVDCARSEDVAPLLARNWVVDVSYEVGQLWGMVRPLDGVTVFEDPSDATWTGPQVSPTRFYVPPGQVVLSAPTATPAVTAAAPTRWPTRLPVALGALQTLRPAPATTQSPAGPSPTPPLTPIISTPTPPVPIPPVATEQSSAERLLATPAPPVSPTPPVEVALGRPGLGLLLAGLPPTRAAPPSATPPPPTMTPAWAPRATSPPILPSRSVAPTPESNPDELQPLLRLWRSLMSLVVH
ncbi:MAG: hypothetical protein CVU38_01030 [Chloroflexi bacterium HGW-Chloroflexi-1]|nr:MAG: hypothetical protein CVU38_01030 [Chloroflexi bacterium HGW-Chloroflexi-1]